MVRLGIFKGTAWVLTLAAAASIARAQAVWIGGFPDTNINSPTNWTGGALPDYTDGSQIVYFSSTGGSGMTVDIPNIWFSGIQSTVSNGVAQVNIYGPNSIELGSGGIFLRSFEDEGTLFSSAAGIQLGAIQTWNAGPAGYIVISGVVSGSGALTLTGENTQYYEFDNGANTFSGGLSVGDFSTLDIEATGSPLGTGSVLMGDGALLQSQMAGTVTLPNNFTFGDESEDEAPVRIGRPNNPTGISTSYVFTGTTLFDSNEPDGSDSEIDLASNTRVTFAGALDGVIPGVCIDFGAAESAVNAVFVIQGTFGPNINRVDLEDGVSVILDGPGISQFATLSRFDTDFNTYLGLGAGYVGHVNQFLNSSQIDPSSFNGTLGFDNTTGGVSTFNDSIDLSAFTGNFVGLGSATPGQTVNGVSIGASNVILTGLITPPGGLSIIQPGSPNPGTFAFGGGGGTLQVTSSLEDGNWFDGDANHVIHNNLQLNPGNGPLTLILSGGLIYTGTTSISDSALILDTPFPSGNSISMGEDDDAGYLGSTTRSGFLNDDSGAAGTHPQDFINLLGTMSTGVVGFDDITGGTRLISGAIDMSAYPGIYLGSATSVTYAGTIIPYNSNFMFSGVKGGSVTVTSPSISGSVSLSIGLPSPIESFGSVSRVIIPGDNYFTGDTTLYSGYLYVGTSNSINQSGTLFVPGPNGKGTDPVGLAPYNGDVSVLNPIQISQQDLHLNYAGSPYTLYLSGDISNAEGEGGLIVDGPVTLLASSEFQGSVTVNGTTLNVNNDEALGNSSGVQANSGSTINFNSTSPYAAYLQLTHSTATFEAASSPVIDELQMAEGSTVTFGASSTAFIDGMQNDEPNSGNVIALGTYTSLTFDFDADPDYHGTFTGPVTSTITVLDGEFNLLGANTGFSGAMKVGSYGFLIASNNAALGTGMVTVEQHGVLGVNTGINVSNPIMLVDGGALAGFGTISQPGGITFANSSSLIPGSATLTTFGLPGSIPVVGNLTFGSSTPITLGQYGTMVFAVQDASGTAGTGYSTVTARGGLTVAANSVAPFDIILMSYASGSSASNPADNFSSSLPYSWTLIASSTPIVGFNAASFTIDPSGFANDIGGGGFYITENGNNLVLNFSPVPEPSTWALIGSGVAALTLVGFRRRKAAVVR